MVKESESTFGAGSTQEEWDSLALFFDQHHRQEGNILRREFYDPVMLEMLGNLSGQVVLDAGCGNGYFTEEIARKAEKVIGIDSSPTMIVLSRSRNTHANVDYQVADLTQSLPLPGASVDVAYSNLVLQYISDLYPVAEELARVIKENGRLLIGVEHPAVMNFLHAQAMLGVKPPKLKETAPYFDRRGLERNILDGQAKVTIYNRPLEDYCSPFMQRGFAITGIKEPQITEETIKIHPEYRRIKDSPRFLLLEFTKLPLQTKITGREVMRRFPR